jgi:hypothetical protein
MELVVRSVDVSSEEEKRDKGSERVAHQLQRRKKGRELLNIRDNKACLQSVIDR